MKKIFALVFGLSFIFLIGWSGYWLTIYLYNFARTLPEEQLYDIATGVLAFIVAPGIIAGAIRYGLSRVALKTGNERKIAVYEEVAVFCLNYLSKEAKTDKEQPLQNFEKFKKNILSYKPAMVINGGPEVVQKYLQLLNMEDPAKNSMKRKGGIDKDKKMIQEFVKAMRRDLGNGGWAGSIDGELST